MNNYIKRKLLEDLKVKHYTSNPEIPLDLSRDNLYRTLKLVKDENKLIIQDLIHGTCYSKIASDIKNKFENYSNNFRNFYAFRTNDTLKEVRRILNESDNSYFVGGTVRDILSGKVPKDYDFCTDIPYDDLSKLFKENGFRTDECGKNFLVLIVSKNGYQFEIANFRSDENIIEGRHNTSVRIGNIYEDSARRDFYINAIYVNTKTLNVIDPTGYSIEDLDNNILRFIGNHKDRIKEDYLRVIRFYKFINRGYIPYPKHLKVVREMFSESIKNTSPERIRNELESIIQLRK